MMLRQELMLAQREKALGQPLLASAAPSPKDFPELFYHQQKLDHFNPDNRTFSQRYFMNFNHFKPGGPIFLNIGGEGPMSPLEVSGYLVNSDFAERTGGGTISLVCTAPHHTTPHNPNPAPNPNPNPNPNPSPNPNREPKPKSQSRVSTPTPTPTLTPGAPLLWQISAV